MKHILASLALCCACAARTDTQTPDDSVAVEIAAARDLLARHPRPVHVDSAYAHPGQAPGSPTARYRPSPRHRTLADSLNGRRVPADTTSAARIILTEPEFAGDSALVTVTVSYDTGRRPRGSFYETMLVVLRRTGTVWRVERRVQLGIS